MEDVGNGRLLVSNFRYSRRAQAPTSAARNGCHWVLSLTGGLATVTLSDDADGVVVADAIRVVAV